MFRASVKIGDLSLLSFHQPLHFLRGLLNVRRTAAQPHIIPLANPWHVLAVARVFCSGALRSGSGARIEAFPKQVPTFWP